MSFRLFTSFLISTRATHTHSRPLSFAPFINSNTNMIPNHPLPLHLCTFQTPTKSAEMSAKATLPCACVMCKCVKPVPIKSVSIIDSPYFHHIRNKKNTIMEIMNLYNKIKK